jgi:hypothetical protein
MQGYNSDVGREKRAYLLSHSVLNENECMAVGRRERKRYPKR